MSNEIVVVGGEVWTGRAWQRASVRVRDGRIEKIVESTRSRAFKVVDAGGAKVLPGLIDLQIHGAFGRSFGSASAAEIAEVAGRLASLGVTGFLATLPSLPLPQTVQALGRIHEASVQQVGSPILGAHLEGPFLNSERAGAHRPEHIRAPNLVEFTKLVTAGDAVTKMVTLAPEVKGAVSLIAAGVKRGIAMALGHSSATRDEVEEAVRAGACAVTHLFNAMSAFHHREENILSAALVDDRVRCACIYDRQHISRSAMQIALRCKPPARLALVSDATAALGAGDGTYEANGMRLEVKGGRVVNAETGTLAGGATSLLQSVRHAVEDLGVALERAWEMASLVPARLLGLQGKGTLAPGGDGDLVVLEDDWRIRAVLQRGREVYGNRH